MQMNADKPLAFSYQRSSALLMRRFVVRRDDFPADLSFSAPSNPQRRRAAFHLNGAVLFGFPRRLGASAVNIGFLRVSVSPRLASASPFGCGGAALGLSCGEEILDVDNFHSLHETRYRLSPRSRRI